jgi:tRNA (cytidine/uridine-2'-O-)-methyltransferase
LVEKSETEWLREAVKSGKVRSMFWSNWTWKYGMMEKDKSMSRDITKIKHRIIKNPPFNVVLYQPEIPSNTGSIARLCAAAEIRLHLIHPLGFRADDKHLKRAGLDYWYEVDIRHHESFEAFLESMEKGKKANLIAFSKHASLSYTKAKVSHGDYLLFGQETRGLPSGIRNRYSCYKIPIWGAVRSLNLSTSVGIVVYHYLHQLGRF